MRHQLWIVNSSLLIIIVLTLIINFLLRKDIYRLRIKPMPRLAIPEEEEKLPIKIEKIYQNDLFDTYMLPIEEVKPIAPPIPSIEKPTLQKPPVQKKPEFLPPLNIKLKGIMFSSNQEKSTALIEDETAKEKTYRVGEKIKDAQVVRIAKDRIILLRTNGQLDTLYLRKDEIPPQGKARWKNIIKKIDEHSFQIDPNKFKEEVQSLGQLLEELAAATAYDKDQPIGVRIGTVEHQSLGYALGLQSNDLIVSVNNIEVATVQGRMDVFSLVNSLQLNDQIIVKLKRNQHELERTFVLKQILTAKIPPFGKGPQPDEKVKKAGLFKLSREQQREQRLRQFNSLHPPREQEKTTNLIQKRLLESMKRREQNRRIW